MSIGLKFEINSKIVDYLGRIVYLFTGRNFSMLFDQKLFETYQRFFDIDDNFMFRLDEDEEHEVRLVEEGGLPCQYDDSTDMQDDLISGNYLFNNRIISNEVEKILDDNILEHPTICFARMLYYLYYYEGTEKSMGEIFGNLEGKKSVRKSFRKDIQSSEAYIIYKFLKLSTIPTALSDGEHWNYFAKLFGYDDKVDIFKKKMKLLFKKRMQIFFHKIMRAASYYYDTIDDLKK